MKKVFVLHLIVFLCVFLFPMNADVTLPHILSSNMVFQQGAEIKIWGWADANEKITVSFHRQVKHTVADVNGNWDVVLNPMKYGGPYEMTIKGKNKISLSNILIGEVWICSGQSNMEWPVSGSLNAEEEIANANYKDIRVFNVPNNMRSKPVEDIPEQHWDVCSPETIGGFSAVGYYFGRALLKNLNVPIGLIGANWGGSMIETWMNEETLRKIPGYNNFLTDSLFERYNIYHPELIPRYDSLLNSFGETKGGIVDGQAVWANPLLEDSNWKEIQFPNYMSDLGYIGLHGKVWFRKEINLPEKPSGNSLYIQLGKAFQDKAWINGILLGETKGAKKIRTYKIEPEILQKGKNVITLCISNYAGDCGMGGVPDDSIFLHVDNKQILLAGTWKFRLTPQDCFANPFLHHPNDLPASLFNGMIYPVRNISLKGAIWYQGESNVYEGNAWQYRELLPLMIRDWRKVFHNSDMPFLIVQLANLGVQDSIPSESEWAVLRESQAFTAKNAQNAGLAVTIDIGEANQIHYKNKQEVGRRLALSARNVTYSQTLVHSGPVYRSMEVRQDKIKIYFDNIGSGLIVKGKYGYLKGFAIAGDDGKYKCAKAYIESGTVIVYHEEVPNPVTVRYAWATNPQDANLYNKEGLPAVPFRTDDYKVESWNKNTKRYFPKNPEGLNSDN